MSNNKQSSSVDWMIEQILLKHPQIAQFLPNWNFDKSIVDQAKAMHKEEHRKTYNQGLMSNFQNFEDYYNETYGGNK
jgi:hypothetical protein